jgi:hypothetical protein
MGRGAPEIPSRCQENGITTRTTVVSPLPRVHYPPPAIAALVPLMGRKALPPATTRQEHLDAAVAIPRVLAASSFIAATTVASRTTSRDSDRAVDLAMLSSAHACRSADSTACRGTVARHAVESWPGITWNRGPTCRKALPRNSRRCSTNYCTEPARTCHDQFTEPVRSRLYTRTTASPLGAGAPPRACVLRQ